MIDVQMFPANVIDHDGHPLLASVSDLNLSVGRKGDWMESRILLPPKIE